MAEFDQELAAMFYLEQFQPIVNDSTDNFLNLNLPLCNNACIKNLPFEVHYNRQY